MRGNARFTSRRIKGPRPSNGTIYDCPLCVPALNIALRQQKISSCDSSVETFGATISSSPSRFGKKNRSLFMRAIHMRSLLLPGERGSEEIRGSSERRAARNTSKIDTGT